MQNFEETNREQESEKTTKAETEQSQEQNDTDSNNDSQVDSGENIVDEKLADVNTPDKDLQKEIESLKAYKEKFYYVSAEMQNLEKRFEKEKQNLLKYGQENILSDLLDVLDNFDRTMGYIRKDEDKKVQNIAVGIDMIQKQLFEALGKHGLEKVEALGKVFDPNFHEAISQVAHEGSEDDTIHEVQQEGYLLNNRLLRAAKVVVVKNEN